MCYGLLYNKAVFEACGIDGSTLKSYDDIDAAFGKVQDAIDAGELADQFPDLEAVVSLPAAESCTCKSWCKSGNSGRVWNCI